MLKNSIIGIFAAYLQTKGTNCKIKKQA